LTQALGRKRGREGWRERMTEKTPNGQITKSDAERAGEGGRGREKGREKGRLRGREVALRDTGFIRLSGSERF